MTKATSLPIKTIPGSTIYQYYQRRCAYQITTSMLEGRPRREHRSLEKFFIDNGVRREEQYNQLLVETLGDDCVVLESDEDLSFEEQLVQRAGATIEAMKEGKKAICHGILWQGEGLEDFANRTREAYGLPFQPLFRGEPDVLFRRDIEGESAFGSYIYEVGDVKSSHTSKLCQQMQVTYYSFLLEDLQGVLPTEGYIITKGVLADFAMEGFDIDHTIWGLRHLIEEELWEWLRDQEAFYHLTPRCLGCDFYDRCHQQAIDERDVSLIPYLRYSQKRALVRGGLESIDKLSSATDDQLLELNQYPGVTAEGLQPVRAQAQAMVRQSLVPTPPAVTPQQAVEEITTQVGLDEGYRAVRRHIDLAEEYPTLLLVDLVLEPYMGEEYAALYVLEGDRSKSIQTFCSAELEISFGQRPLDFFVDALEEYMNQREKAVLLHYGGNFLQKIERVGAVRSGRRSATLLRESLAHRILDLRKVLRRWTCLPVPTYNLEDVANALWKLAERPSPGFYGWDQALSQFVGLEEVITPLHMEPQEVGDIPPVLLFRLFLESGHPIWWQVLQWKVSETLRAQSFLYQCLCNYRELFAPHLDEFPREGDTPEEATLFSSQG